MFGKSAEERAAGEYKQAKVCLDLSRQHAKAGNAELAEHQRKMADAHLDGAALHLDGTWKS